MCAWLLPVVFKFNDHYHQLCGCGYLNQLLLCLFLTLAVGMIILRDASIKGILNHNVEFGRLLMKCVLLGESFNMYQYWIRVTLIKDVRRNCDHAVCTSSSTYIIWMGHVIQYERSNIGYVVVPLPRDSFHALITVDGASLTKCVLQW